MQCSNDFLCLLRSVISCAAACRYWEVVETVKKLMLTGFAVFFAQGTLIQLVVSLCLMLVYTLWMMRVQPFRNPIDNKFALISAVLLQGTP